MNLMIGCAPCFILMSAPPGIVPIRPYGRERRPAPHVPQGADLAYKGPKRTCAVRGADRDSMAGSGQSRAVLTSE